VFGEGRHGRAKLGLIGLAIAFGLPLALPAIAAAQATRTWVSGVGDDANPCSRTAPCKTFAGAISKTATGGVIDVLDPGGFGALTITKPITIDGGKNIAGVLVSGTNGITINVSAGSGPVILRNLDFEGIGSGLIGVSVVRAPTDVRIENCQIYGFTQQGISFAPALSPVRLSIINTTINDNGGDGILVQQGTSGSGANRLTIRNSFIDQNGGDGIDLQAPNATFKAGANIFNTSITDNLGDGILSNGAQATVRMTADTISGNVQGLLATNGGLIDSSGNNAVFGNNTDGAPTSTVPLV
jgi:hypothetical protein